jgi:hypothetical protein
MSMIHHCTEKVEVAGIWLAAHRQEVVEPILPFIRRKFELTNLQAIEACKLAHRLAHDGRKA